MVTVQTFNYIVYSVIVVFSMFVIGFVIYKKYKNKIVEKFNDTNYVRAIIIQKNGQFKIISAIAKTNKFNYSTFTYIIDEKAIIFKKNIPYLFYYQNNPNPITFQEDKMLIDSGSLKQMLETKVLQDLFTNPKEFGLIMVAVGINIIITGVVLMKQFNIGFK